MPPPPSPHAASTQHSAAAPSVLLVSPIAGSGGSQFCSPCHLEFLHPISFQVPSVDSRPPSMRSSGNSADLAVLVEHLLRTWSPRVLSVQPERPERHMLSQNTGAVAPAMARANEFSGHDQTATAWGKPDTCPRPQVECAADLGRQVHRAACALGGPDCGGKALRPGTPMPGLRIPCRLQPPVVG